MAEIPSFFNKADFLGALLPGYIGVILGVVILFPEYVPMKNDSGLLALDFFSAVVFLVAGPAVGYTLRQIQLIFNSLVNLRSQIQAMRYNLQLRNELSDSERETLNLAESRYYFNSSTGIVLVMAGGYFSYLHGISLEWGSIPLIAISSIFFIGAHVEKTYSVQPEWENMYEKYKNDVNWWGKADK